MLHGKKKAQELESRTPCYKKKSRIAKKNTERTVTPYECNFTRALLRLFMFPSYYNPLSPIRTFTRDTLGYTRISRPPTAFVTLPILIPHDARCDPTREDTASRENQEI